MCGCRGVIPGKVFQTMTAAALRVTSAVAGWPSRTAATMTNGKMTNASGGSPIADQKNPSRHRLHRDHRSRDQCENLRLPPPDPLVLMPHRRENGRRDEESAERIARPPFAPEFAVARPRFNSADAQRRDAEGCADDGTPSDRDQNERAGVAGPLERRDRTRVAWTGPRPSPRPRACCRSRCPPQSTGLRASGHSP